MAAIFTGGQWQLGPVGTSAVAVSCSSDGSCVAVDNSGGTVVYSGGTWSSVTKIDGNNTFAAVSCPAVSTCAAADQNDNVLFYSAPTG
jgi:hypothetical protein